MEITIFVGLQYFSVLWLLKALGKAIWYVVLEGRFSNMVPMQFSTIVLMLTCPRSTKALLFSSMERTVLSEKSTMSTPGFPQSKEKRKRPNRLYCYEINRCGRGTIVQLWDWILESDVVTSHVRAC